MRERGNTDLAVDIQYSGALSSGDSATGAGQYKPGETCVVVANATTPGRTFAYWTDEEGNILSEDQWYEFAVERDTLLTAVFADKAKVAPEVRLGSADGRQAIGARAKRCGRWPRHGDELHDVCGQACDADLRIQCGEVPFRPLGELA